MALEGIPSLTLGWGVLEWCSQNLVNPDGENMGDPWIFSPEQARHVLHWYAIDDKGKFLYRRSLLMRPKGAGKSPFLAAICSAELLGPVRFSHFNKNNDPIGKPHPTPLIQLVAVSEAQTENTMSLIREMLGLGNASKNYYIDIGQTRILSAHGRIEPVTANAKSREGQRLTFAVLDESHLWIPSNRGDVLANTLRRNLGKVAGRSIETSNAFHPGEGSVAEASYAYYQDIKAGLAKNPGFLYDSSEAPEGTPYRGPGRRAGLIEAYGDAASERGGWVDLDRIEQEMDDPATTEADGRRFYFNQIVQGYSQWLDPDAFNKLESISVSLPRERIALGFDGSIRNDSTALVACRLSDGFIWPIEVWEKPDNAPDDWEVPFLLVDKCVRETLKKHDVAFMYADPAYWQDIVGRWSLDHEDIVYEFWTHRKAAMAKAIERFETAVNTGQLSWSGLPEHEVLKRHALNAHADETPSGKLIRKEFPQSKRKIDAVMAAVLAFEARAAAIADGRLNPDAVVNQIYSF